MKRFNDLASVTRIYFNPMKILLLLGNIILELQKIFRHFIMRTELLILMIYTINNKTDLKNSHASKQKQHSGRQLNLLYLE